jgi:uncharacterized spore protein YtfJ
MSELTAAIQSIDKTIERLGADAVFGEPRKEGAVTLIPVARVSFGYGYGFGQGPAKAQGEQEPEEEKPAEASGGGIGAGGGAKPLGYIQISAEGVEYKPIQDETRIAMAGIAMVAWIVFWGARATSAVAKAVAQWRREARE